MDNPRGAFGAGLPGTAPRTAGPALHHEQTVGKTVSCCSFCRGVINGALHVLFKFKGLRGLIMSEFIVNELTFMTVLSPVLYSYNTVCINR